MTLDPARPFYRLGTARCIGMVPRADLVEFLRSFTRTGFEIAAADDPLALILELAEEVSYNVQHLAHECWNQLFSQSGAGPIVLTGQTVHEALEFIVRSLDPLYTQLWKDLTTVQQKTLLAVIKQEGRGLLATKVTHGMGKGASTIKRTLTALLDRDILREEGQPGAIRYRFEDPFFAQSLRMFSLH